MDNLDGELLDEKERRNLARSTDAIKDKNSVVAAIEFAVLVLKVKDIILCGHSNCGAMKALHMDDKDLCKMPHLRDWLKIAAPVKEMVDSVYPDLTGSSLKKKTEEENILFQLRNIETYPFVVQALNKGELHIHGWYYDIGTGEVYSYNPVKDAFEKIVYDGGKNE